MSALTNAPLAINDEIHITDKALEVSEYSLPRCHALRRAIARAARLQEVVVWADARFQIVLEGGSGRARTLVQIKKPVDGVCTKNDLLFRFDGAGTPFDLKALKARLKTREWADVAIPPPNLRVTSIDFGGGTFIASKNDAGFLLQVELKLADENGRPDEVEGAWARAGVDVALIHAEQRVVAETMAAAPAAAPSAAAAIAAFSRRRHSHSSSESSLDRPPALPRADLGLPSGLPSSSCLSAHVCASLRPSS